MSKYTGSKFFTVNYKHKFSINEGKDDSEIWFTWKVTFYSECTPFTSHYDVLYAIILLYLRGKQLYTYIARTLSLKLCSYLCIFFS